MGIYNKLLNIQRKIIGLAKDGNTSSGNYTGYKYVTGGKVLSYIRPLMDSEGLILKQEIISIDNERIDYQTKNGMKSEILSKVMMRFTWIDAESGETDVNLFGANGQNEFEKGLGSALTYAERYFLLKFFHISTDEDDIDNPNRKPKENQDAKPVAKKNLPKDQFSSEKLMDWVYRHEKETKSKGQRFSLHSLIEQHYNVTNEELNIISNNYTQFKINNSYE